MTWLYDHFGLKRGASIGVDIFPDNVEVLTQDCFF